jgi:hypothetical protein
MPDPTTSLTPSTNQALFEAAWAASFSPNSWDADDCACIVQTAREEFGITLAPWQAKMIWETWSRNMSATWLSVDAESVRGLFRHYLEEGHAIRPTAQVAVDAACTSAVTDLLHSEEECVRVARAPQATEGGR